MCLRECSHLFLSLPLSFVGFVSCDVVPAVPLPPPAALAGDPAATADEVGEEAEDLFGWDSYDDSDEEHHDDTDGERTDE